MPQGFDTEQRVVYLNDSAELYAYLADREDTQIGDDDLIQVTFTIQRPDGTKDINLQGEVQEDGSGFLRYENTNLTGEYIAVATFLIVTGEKRSTRSDFQVDDPFEITDPYDLAVDPSTINYAGIVEDRVWHKMEDVFDSRDGGPWLRDMTMSVFDRNRISDFIDEAVFDINVYNPPTDLTILDFTLPTTVMGEPRRRPNADLTLLVQGTWVAVIRHLMRSYTEQSTPQGGQVAYEDRRDYLQRWGTMYQIEFQHYDHLVKMWKRKLLGLHHSKQLVSSKAGRLLPAPLRTRNIGRGYY